MKQENLKSILLLQILLVVYSSTGIFSKFASVEPFLSFRFCVFYALMIVFLGIYAIGWQQIIKKIPLTTAYANKAVTTIWGLIWGILFFQEQITIGKLIGVGLVTIGVLLFSSDKGE